MTRRRMAVIGQACWYPGARTPLQLWENVLAARREFRRIPEIRTPLAAYYYLDPKVPDKFYQPHAAVIDGFSFDWQRYKIPQATFKSTDVAQWLALETAANAISDAGYQREEHSA